MHADSTLARNPAPSAAQRLRVLLVEDSARLAASIRDYLERQNYEVFIEGDGNAVAERFDRLKPDLVILDLMLPGKDGLTICRELRGIDYDGLDRSIDARICRLRRKLQEAGGAESMIKTVRLRGYLFAGEG